MIDVKVDTDIPKALEILKGVQQKQWPFLLSYSANNTAKQLVPYLKEQMPKYIDRPAPFTLKNLWSTYGNKANPEVTIGWRPGLGTSAGKYLKALVEGGNRKQKRFESALSRVGVLPTGYVLVPTSALPKDQYGNVAGAGTIYRNILTFFQANVDAAQVRRIKQLSRMSAGKLASQYFKAFRDKDKIAKREARAKAKAARYVVFTPNNPQGMSPGIWERTTTLSGKRNSGMRLLFSMQSAAKYQQRFPFYSVLANKAREVFPKVLAEAINKFKPRS